MTSISHAIRSFSLLAALVVATWVAGSQQAQADEGRWRFGGRLGLPLTTEATYYYSCSAPYGSDVCSGSPFSIDSVDTKGGHSPIFEGFGLIRVGGSFYLGATLGYHTSNAFTNKLNGKTNDFGADISIAPTVEWSPAISEQMTLALGVRVGAFAVLPGGDLENELVDMRSACTKIRAAGGGCTVEEGPVWDSQVTLSAGLRYRLERMALRAELAFQAQSARDMISLKAGSGSTDYEFTHTLNQWSRTMLLIGADM